MKCTLPAVAHPVTHTEALAITPELAGRLIAFIFGVLETQENMSLGFIDEKEARALLQEMTK